MVAVPIKYAEFVWGWPKLFVSRMERVNTRVILIDQSHGVTDGIDDPELVKQLAEDYRGIIWTDKIERLASIKR